MHQKHLKCSEQTKHSDGVLTETFFWLKPVILIFFGESATEHHYKEKQKSSFTSNGCHFVDVAQSGKIVANPYKSGEGFQELHRQVGVVFLPLTSDYGTCHAVTHPPSLGPSYHSQHFSSQSSFYWGHCTDQQTGKFLFKNNLY